MKFSTCNVHNLKLLSVLPQILLCVLLVKGRCFSSHAIADVPEDGMVHVPLAQTGEGIAECELLQWFVQEVRDRCVSFQIFYFFWFFNLIEKTASTIRLVMAVLFFQSRRVKRQFFFLLSRGIKLMNFSRFVKFRATRLLLKSQAVTREKSLGCSMFLATL